MARNIDGIFSDIFATSGDKATPPFSIDDGFTPPYSQPINSGGLAPERTTFNYLYNQLYALGVDVNRYGGALIWNATTTFEIGAVVSGTNGRLYISITQNTNVNPVTDGGVNWAIVPTELELASNLIGEGSDLVTFTGNATTVTNALNDRPTSSALAATGGASLIGTGTGETVEQRLDSVASSEIIAYFQKSTGGSTIDFSFGFSSITTSGTNDGVVTAVFSTPQPSINYRILNSVIFDATTTRILQVKNRTTTQFEIRSGDTNNDEGGSGMYVEVKAAP